MSDIHLTADLLAAVSRGDLPARVLTEVGLNHLLNLCPTCREGFQLWQEQRRRPTADYEVAFRVIPPLLKRHAEEADEKRRRGERDLLQLLRLGQPERLARIRRANARFKGSRSRTFCSPPRRRRCRQTPGDCTTWRKPRRRC